MTTTDHDRQATVKTCSRCEGSRIEPGSEEYDQYTHLLINGERCSGCSGTAETALYGDMSRCLCRMSGPIPDADCPTHDYEASIENGDSMTTTTRIDWCGASTYLYETTVDLRMGGNVEHQQRALCVQYEDGAAKVTLTYMGETGRGSQKHINIPASEIPALVRGLCEAAGESVLVAEAERLREENARLRAELGRPLTADERAFLDGV